MKELLATLKGTYIPLDPFTKAAVMSDLVVDLRRANFGCRCNSLLTKFSISTETSSFLIDRIGRFANCSLISSSSRLVTKRLRFLNPRSRSNTRKTLSCSVHSSRASITIITLKNFLIIACKMSSSFHTSDGSKFFGLKSLYSDSRISSVPTFPWMSCAIIDPRKPSAVSLANSLKSK